MEYVNALRASYFMSYRVAKTGEPHTITEDFLIPAMKAVVKCMLGEKAEEKLDSIPLSNDTVSRCIADMAENVLSQLVNRVRNSDYYSLQLDKSTDLDSLAKLLVYVRYMYESTIHEDFLFCHSLSTQTTEEEIFLLLDNFMSENRIDWSRCVGISTDGAKSMMGKHSGVVVRIKAVATEATWVYCSIDREALASQKMPENLMSVLSDAVKMVNFITGQCQNSRIFATLCDEMGNDHLPLLMHTEVRWLSRGKVLTRLFELHSELQVFFTDHLPFAQSSCLEDTAWLQRLAYLADIFSCLNELSLGLQGLSTTIFKTQDKIESMIKKLLFWDSCLKRNEIDSFPTLQEFLAANDNMVLHECVKADIMEHLQQLSKQLRKYFPKMDNANSWIRNPFKVP
ncbi:zinc finger BED domain-containing protein 5-like [Terrapene carolina triunguis]|uniref:zinc finger BED domain-containing protein 5-like n=1 Tax=Terrapene triunguis TaxID=2587831 RepID=UPI000E778E76|nr:zinc finger BED domain-containing protein 5-like [Terrapene carolina triunguis]XP_026508960.1 zinc finger BED domain-containing protein 5-like [Terrapene carolina triunguis]XP_026508962.1 zinc finger BED domain-containing protein 5-like [Terrapene carolina triunguis]XP_026508963.1 zinc finger BED domain-containing protein 5-like [Terrapene carolina triunguis]